MCHVGILNTLIFTTIPEFPELFNSLAGCQRSTEVWTGFSVFVNLFFYDFYLFVSKVTSYTKIQL